MKRTNKQLSLEVSALRKALDELEGRMRRATEPAPNRREMKAKRRAEKIAENFLKYCKK